jgi:carboxylesterase
MPCYRCFVRIALLTAVLFIDMDCAGRQAIDAQAATADRDPATGIMRGAEPVHIDRGRRRACLLLHGWLTTPADFGMLPGELDSAGWDVYVPLHPGHGTCPADLGDITAEMLLDACRRHYEALAARYGEVVLVGFSMGGTIATILASERPPSKLVLIAPFFGVSHKWYYVLPARWWATVAEPFVDHIRRSRRLIRVNDRSRMDRIVAYDAFPTSILRELFRLRDMAHDALESPSLAMPTIALYSEGDEAASPRAVEHALSRMASEAKRTETFSRSNHLLLQDYDRQAVAATILGFLGDD